MVLNDATYNYSQYTSDAGLLYLRARAYEPATAQFMSVDLLEAVLAVTTVLASTSARPFFIPGGDAPSPQPHQVPI